MVYHWVCWWLCSRRCIIPGPFGVPDWQTASKRASLRMMDDPGLHNFRTNTLTTLAHDRFYMSPDEGCIVVQGLTTRCHFIYRHGRCFVCVLFLVVDNLSFFPWMDWVTLYGIQLQTNMVPGCPRFFENPFKTFLRPS